MAFHSNIQVPYKSFHGFVEVPPLTAMKRQRSPLRDIGGAQQKRCQDDDTILMSALECSNAPSFIQKTYHMLSTSNPDNACWSEDGTKIIVKDKKRFEQEDMKQYFTINKFASFSRQLNLYGFKKKSTGSCWDGQEVFFHNPLFMRDRIDLLNQIKRSSSKPTNATSQPIQEEELQKMQEQKINILEEKVASLEAQLSKLSQDVTLLFNGQNIPAHSRPNSINSLLDIIDTTTMPALTKTKNMKRATSSVSSQFDLLIDGSQEMDEFFDSKFDMSTTDLGRPTTHE